MGSTVLSDDEPQKIILPTPKIFLLNGPPRAGKDTAAARLSHFYSGGSKGLKKFAAPIKDAVTAIYHGGNREEFNRFDTAELKDTPQEVYFGKTCRQVQIGVSENFLKPFHNDSGIFGKILRNDIQRDLETDNDWVFKTYFISDSGFRPEAEILIEEFGAENVILFRIFREGYTFKGDSRGYITLKDLGVREFDIHNQEDNLSAFYASLEQIVEYCIPKE